MKSIGHQRLNLPSHAPLMVLPGTQLFPHALLPLFIFEPRYREMLAWSLEQDRMFCIAPMKPGISEADTTDDFYHVVGLGMVRACVGRDDGTSNLILQGLARVRITGFLQDAPFRIAEVRELSSRLPSPTEREPLATRLHEICDRIFAGKSKLPPALEEQLAQVSDPAVLTDMLAHACVEDPEARQAIFEELDVVHRAALLTKQLGGG
ncbi:MAG TPA: LON peptidase substrate-binding domain-containing protein [Chthoniobacter sp.]